MWFFRLGLVLIPYLNNGNYTGVDISSKRIIGRQKLHARIKKNQYTVIVNKRNVNLEKLFKNKFDFIYLESVVTHMPKDDLQELLHAFTKILNKNGIIFFTFYKGDFYKKLGIKDFLYPIDLIKDYAKNAGFKAVIDKDWFDEKFPMARLKFINN